jgi:hypothetical protein
VPRPRLQAQRQEGAAPDDGRDARERADVDRRGQTAQRDAHFGGANLDVNRARASVEADRPAHRG